MVSFAALNCKVGYSIEGIPTCTTLTKVKPTEAYYIFSESDDTQAFEGFKDKSTSKAGYWETQYIHPLAYDLSTPVYIAATNATPHAYIKSLIDTYFKFCDYSATSIDDSFAAMDFPAYNGQSAAYVIRAISQLKANWLYCAKTSLTLYWNDGTTNGAKHIRFGTEPVINAEQEGDPIAADSVTLTGGFLAGTRLTSTAHATTPGSVDVTENFPEIVTQTPLDNMSAAMLAVYEQAQIYWTVGSAKRGLHQIGNTMLFDSGGKLATGELTVFIHGASYDLVEKKSFVRLGKYMMLPYRSRLKPQELNQLIDNVEKNVADNVYTKTEVDAIIDALEFFPLGFPVMQPYGGASWNVWVGPIINLGTTATYCVLGSVGVPDWVDVTSARGIRVWFSWGGNQAATATIYYRIQYKESGELLTGIDIATTIEFPAGNTAILRTVDLPIAANALEAGDIVSLRLFRANSSGLSAVDGSYALYISALGLV